jgi:5'-3' exonuclease
MKHYKEYKQSREERLDTFNKEIFKHTISTLLPKLQEKYVGCVTLSLNHVEADDIVAIVKRHIRSIEPTKEIFIITNDNDYLQLIDDYTLIINLQGKDLKERLEGETPKQYLLKKIIVGDKSDNIPSIAKKIGDKTSSKLAADPESLDTLFKKNPDAEKQFQLNKLLISFDMIPQKYQTSIVNLYKEIRHY